MVLAAGLGTRLRPLTDDRPKALVEVGGRAMLDLTLARLRGIGISEVIVNVHHFADKVIEYLQPHKNFGMRIEVSREETLLDTGGGLKKAAWFFLADSRQEPLLVHNVDVLSTIDLRRLVEFHAEQNALATLAVQTRETSRYLLFDDQLRLCGRRAGRDAKPEIVRPCANPQAFAFTGVHVISPRLLNMMTEQGAFSVIATYLRLSGAGEPVLAFDADSYYWRDLGRPENVAQAAVDLRDNAALRQAYGV
jgi:NDP-sugar pyrophosphorylase family protein